MQQLTRGEREALCILYEAATYETRAFETMMACAKMMQDSDMSRTYAEQMEAAATRAFFMKLCITLDDEKIVTLARQLVSVFTKTCSMQAVLDWVHENDEEIQTWKARFR